MIRFDQTFGAHAGRVLEFDVDRITFGRLPDMDVVFDPNLDLDASGRHAEVRREPEGWVLVDVGSRNGTFVQGRRVTRHVLRDGEEIEFGSGGPRLRARLAMTPDLAAHGRLSPGAPTGAATPIDTPEITGRAETMLAPGGATPQWTEPTRDSPPGRVPQTSPPPAPAHVITTPTDAADAPARRYGERTVGLMIGAALERAKSGGAPDPRPSRPSSAPLLVAVGCLALMVLSLGVALAVALLRG